VALSSHCGCWERAGCDECPSTGVPASICVWWTDPCGVQIEGTALQSIEPRRQVPHPSQHGPGNDPTSPWWSGEGLRAEDGGAGPKAVESVFWGAGSRHTLPLNAVSKPLYRFMRCETKGVTFRLVERCGSYEWLFPDGTSTGLRRASQPEARRAMMYRALGLADEWNAKH
jgi:hypothetical protein